MSVWYDGKLIAGLARLALRAQGYHQMVQDAAALRLVSPTSNLDFSGLQSPAEALYMFDATSTAADDGDTVIKPTAIAPASPGRWIKITAGGGGGGIPIPPGSVQGDVLIRNATQWTRLAAAFAGQPLQTNGVAADAGWGPRHTSAASAPAVGNDSTQGYAPGSIWVDTAANRVYACVDASVGAAIWKPIDFGEVTIWKDCRSIFDATAPYKTSTNTSFSIGLKMQFPGTNDVGTPSLVEVMTQAGNTNVVGEVQLVDVTNSAAPFVVASGTLSFAARQVNQDYIDSLTIAGPPSPWSPTHAILEVQFRRVSGTGAFRISEVSIEQNV